MRLIHDYVIRKRMEKFDREQSRLSLVWNNKWEREKARSFGRGEREEKVEDSIRLVGWLRFNGVVDFPGTQGHGRNVLTEEGEEIRTGVNNEIFDVASVINKRVDPD